MKYTKGDLIRYNVNQGPPQICLVIEFLDNRKYGNYIVLDFQDNQRKKYYAPFVEDPTCWIKLS